MRYFDHPFPHELRRLLINASAHCAPSRLHSTGQELQRMSFLAAICRDNPDAVRELATDSYISNLAQRFRASSEQSTHVATLVMRVLVQAGTDTCVEVLERIAAAVHDELTKRARHIDRRAATASSGGGGMAGELDGKGDMGVETALWVEEQRVQVADHLAELRAITSAPRGVCILDWASPAHPPEAFSRFEREMLFASPSVLDTLWSTRAARRVVHNMFGTGSRTGTPPPLPVDIAASPAARLAEYLQQHSGTDMAALRSPATVQAVQTAAHARVALTHADMIPGSYAAMHVPRPTSATHSVSGPAADALHKHRAVVEPAAVDLASVLPIDLRPAPIPLPDSMRAPSGVHRGPGLLLGFLANDVAGAVVAGLWGHFAATGDVAVVDRVAELVTALGTVLSHKEWCSIVEDVGVSKYTVSGPVVALEKAAELASTMVGDKYGSDNPANLQQRLVLFAGFSALRSLQENVVRYPEVRHRVACMLDLQDLGGEGSEGLRALTAAHTPVPAPNAATKSSAGRAAGDDEATTSSVGSTPAEPESPPVFMGPEAGMVQLSMVPLLLAPPAADSSSERGM